MVADDRVLEKEATDADAETGPCDRPTGISSGDLRNDAPHRTARDLKTGLVIYTDAGSNPNPGPTGWGVHGYLYTDATPAKGSGNSRWLLTRKGYVEKYDAAKRVGLTEVTPTHYVDGYGSILANGERKPTSNVGELTAAVRALEYAQDFDVKRIIVRVDSEYVRRGMESWVATWESNGWLKRGGEPVPNVELWKELTAARARLIGRGAHVKFIWVKSHSHHLGNVLADKLATIGIALSTQGVLKNEISSAAAQGYWKYDTGRHPMLANRCLYFNTVAQYQQPGEYYLGDHGKEDELLGKRISDGAHTVARLAQPDAAIELIRNYTTELAGGLDSIVIVRLDQLFSATTHRELLTWGASALLRPNAWRLDLNCLDEEPGGHTHKPLSRECRPPRIAMRAIEAISGLIERLRLYEAHDPSIATTDLTDQLYATTEKPAAKKGEAQVVMELRPEYGVGLAAMSVSANYRIDGGTAGSVASIPLTSDAWHRPAQPQLAQAAGKSQSAGHPHHVARIGPGFPVRDGCAGGRRYLHQRRHVLEPDADTMSITDSGSDPIKDALLPTSAVTCRRRSLRETHPACAMPLASAEPFLQECHEVWRSGSRQARGDGRVNAHSVGQRFSDPSRQNALAAIHQRFQKSVSPDQARCESREKTPAGMLAQQATAFFTVRVRGRGRLAQNLSCIVSADTLSRERLGSLAAMLRSQKFRHKLLYIH